MFRKHYIIKLVLSSLDSDWTHFESFIMPTVLKLVFSPGSGGTQHSNVGCLPSSPSLVALLMVCDELLKSFVFFFFLKLESKTHRVLLTLIYNLVVLHHCHTLPYLQ